MKVAQLRFLVDGEERLQLEQRVRTLSKEDETLSAMPTLIVPFIELESEAECLAWFEQG